MIFSNMEYPGKDYRVLVYDSWLGEDFHSLDNPQDGDKIVYRELGADGQPKVTKTEIYSNGEWAEEGSGGGGGGGVQFVVPEQAITFDENGTAIEVNADLVSEETTYVFKIVSGDDTYYSDMVYITSEEPHLLFPTQTLGGAEYSPTIELQPDNSWLIFGGSFEGSATVSVIVAY